MQDLTQSNQTPITTFDPQMLIVRAIEQNVPVETMQRLLDMRAQLQAEIAERSYREAMSGFQGDCPIIPKSKRVAFTSKKGSKVNYDYAPLDTVINLTKPLLKQYKLSLRFDVVHEKDPPAIVARAILSHIDGYSEDSQFRVPVDSDNPLMSDPQKWASAATFAKRQATLNVLGVVAGDTDDDTDSLHPRHYEPPEVVPSTVSEETLSALKEKIAAYGLDRGRVENYVAQWSANRGARAGSLSALTEDAAQLFLTTVLPKLVAKQTLSALLETIKGLDDSKMLMQILADRSKHATLGDSDWEQIAIAVDNRMVQLEQAHVTA